MTIPYTKEEVNQAQIASVRDNGLNSAYLRPMAFLVPRAWACVPTI